MYFIELIIKKFFKRKRGEIFNFPENNFETTENSDDCEHIFMPVDSSGEVLACTKCGLVIKKTGENNFLDKT